MTPFKFVPLGRTAVIEGNYRDFAGYVRSGSWKREPADAFLFVNGSLDNPGASHYPFDPEGFSMLAELADDLNINDPERLRRLFFIHETSEAPKVARSAPASQRATVVQQGKLVGVRVPRPGQEPERRRQPPPTIATGAITVGLALPRAAARRGTVASSRRAAAPAAPRRRARAAPRERPKARAPRTRKPRRARAQEPETLQRTPHMDLSNEEPTPGKAFKTKVWLDQEPARDDEESQDVVVELPPGVDEIALHVWLVPSQHFEVSGRLVQQLKIRRDKERSRPVSFDVKVGPNVASSRNAAITAMFAYQGRPAGKVTRRVRIKLPKQARQTRRPQRTRSEGTVLVGTNAGEPDLTVQVAEAADSNGRRFLCRVTSKHLPDLDRAPPVPWNLKQVARDIVVGYMDGFTEDGLRGKQRLARLNGAGVDLFRVAPQNFQDAFWRLLDEKKPFATISIVSAEPFVPWELMIPRRLKEGREELHRPLGVEFAIGRWLDEAALPPRQLFDVDDSYVIAPKYTGDLLLPEAEAEAKNVKKLFRGTRIEPAVFDELERQFEERGAPLVHFVCHGAAATPVAQVIYLEDDERLQSVDLMGMPGAKAACSSKQPLVFLNACEVGRPSPALVGIGGFAKAFIDIGAHGVVAPLWSVVDDIAHDIATAFYKRVTDDPPVSLAEALREIRARAYAPRGGEDSYAAYCFYGDPLATLRVT